MIINVLKLLIGIFLIGIYFWMVFIKDKKIRESKHWYLWWVGSLFILGTGGSLIIEFLLIYNIIQ